MGRTGVLSERIRELRLAKKISQVELAGLIGVTKQSVSNWENDNIQPSIDMLVKIADTLNVSTDYLLARDNRKYLDVTGLSDAQIGHLKLIISDLIGK